MVDETTAPGAAAKKPPQKREAQSVKLINEAEGFGKTLDLIIAQPTWVTQLATVGYPLTELQAGRALATAAQSGVAARTTADSGQEAAAKALKAQDKKVRADFSEFRDSVRGLYAKKADRTALGADGEMPKDRDLAISTMRTGLTNAQTAPYATKLATYGYPAPAIAALLAEVAQWESAINAHATAKGASTGTTEQRNEAYKAMKDWKTQFLPIAKRALKGIPGALAGLGWK